MKKKLTFLSVFLPLMALILFWRTFADSVVAKPQMIDVGGSISTDTIWTLANSPYIITDTVTVEAGATLTVEAGVTIMFQVDMGQSMVVEGHLEVVGTAVNPVTITSIDDLPTNRWLGIYVTSGSANFVHTTLRYTETPLFITGGMGGDVYLETSTIQENSVYPIYVGAEALHRLKMNNVTFSKNEPNRIGIALTGSAGDLANLAGNVLLTVQPGLEAYEVFNDSLDDFPPLLHVPQGITLTLAAGTVLVTESVIVVDGRLEANGTELAPVTIDDLPGNQGYYLYVTETGSAELVHTIIQNAANVGLGMVGQSDETVILRDVVLDSVAGYPIVVDAPSLHRLQMTNVTFQNNIFNRVFVDTYAGKDAIAADVNLKTQPGLELYEFGDAGDPQTPPAEFNVPDGITLTVEPGVELRFGEGAETLVVNGRLQAIGTPTRSITFTSVVDSAPNQWLGIVLENGSAQLDYAEVRYGYYNLLVNNTAVTETVNLQNSQFHSAEMAGLGVAGGAVTAVCSSFNNNNGSGVWVWDTGNPTVDISNSSFLDNVNDGLRNDNVAQVDARNNWWGDASGPAGIGSGNGEAITGNVLFDPWLTEEICTTQPYQLYLPGVAKP